MKEELVKLNPVTLEPDVSGIEYIITEFENGTVFKEAVLSPIPDAPIEKTEEQTKIDQLEMDNALLLMSQAETESRLAQAEADHATLLMELAMKGVI